MLKFMWNGIKDTDATEERGGIDGEGGKLQKTFYSIGPYRGVFPDETISIYKSGYDNFSKAVREAFEVHNETDHMTDYFDTDTIRVAPTHPLYAEVRAAFEKQEEHRRKVSTARSSRT